MADTSTRIYPGLTPEDERLKIRDISLAAESQSKEGDTFFLITQRWWQNWLDYVNQDQIGNDGPSLQSLDSADVCVLRRPSSIDNKSLIYELESSDSSTTELHDTLVEGRDYVLLPEEVWNQLQSWKPSGSFTDEFVRFLNLTLSKYAFMIFMGGRNMHCRLTWTKHLMMLTFRWIRNNDFVGKQSNSFLLEPSKSGLSIAGGLSATKGVSRNNNSELPQGQNQVSPQRESNNVLETSGVTTRSATAGLTGLLNLGNTCFMNSAIQCLVHTPEFTRYFRDDYRGEINWQNPMGMVGELAIAFGELLRKLWAPGRTPISPRPFKAKLARFAPQFSGYNQHDSQELLAFLLDGLHEDLNRVKDKPYILSRDADGRPDEEVADEYWANHKARNDSIIVDVCQGQYKSTLVCPVCSKISVTFDPFMYLSLPLQSTATRPLTVTIFSSDGSLLPNVCTVTIPKQGRCRDLIQALSAACSLQPNEKLLLAEIQNHLIHRFFEDPLTSLCSIKDEDHLAAYRIPQPAKGIIFLQLIHRLEDKETANAQSMKGWKPYGTPLVSPISCDNVTTRGDVQSMVRTMLSPLLKLRELADLEANGISPAVEPSSDTLIEQVDSSESLPWKESNNAQSCGLVKLPLQLVDENNVCIDLSVGEDKPVKISSFSKSLLVFINWSKELLEKYDTSYLENLPEVCKNGPPTKKARTEPLSLYSCLEAFLLEEPLVSEPDMWKCPQCKERRQASKKLDLWRLPKVLVIHLKRFSYNRSIKHKLDTFVNFPIYDLDLTKYIANKNNSDPQLYELYALINHYGGMGSGHYTSDIKLLDENRWYSFDDNHISAMGEEEVKTNAAYVLFYRRKKYDDSESKCIP
ncbi:ubiquitin carboxyl-terminal hydrolase 5 isoform X2 [Beta vulgaris subsp. vulgaris]|uniref:ubiquitin carboxyl-terminal hydrolase 5 isoform X2 n=1 Tax=Beta vulgaris subsp. vulgaris TaxID=3555 RepID=UPI00203733AB|nr:ubiquitin carboxyl-terminal hydrolase 5 isoform X2 [Beta vulgaris subsp. vulgaris]